VFYPTEGRTRHASAEINEDGTYDMPQAPTGKVKIAVNNKHLKEGVPPPIGMPGAPGMPAPKRGTSSPMMMGKGPPKGAEPGPPKSASDKDRAPPPKTTPPKVDKYVPISEKYTNPETSDLTVEVKPGKQKHDIKLQ
jgi:hypothetical protein